MRIEEILYASRFIFGHFSTFVALNTYIFYIYSNRLAGRFGIWLCVILPIALFNILAGKPLFMYLSFHNESIAKEFADNTAVYMGDWKAEKNLPPFSDGKWHLYNYVTDIGENKDLSAQYPDILAKMISYYNKFAKDVGVVAPIGKSALLQAADDATE